jgi:hypothetical protein
MPSSSANSRSRSLPERPTNGRPCLSSSAPGPSPTKRRSASGRPIPNTTWVRPAASGQRVHVEASTASSLRVTTEARLGVRGSGVPGRSHRPDRALGSAYREEADVVDDRIDASVAAATIARRLRERATASGPEPARRDRPARRADSRPCRASGVSDHADRRVLARSETLPALRNPSGGGAASSARCRRRCRPRRSARSAPDDELAVPDRRAAESTGRACSRPRHFPIVAPAPAPMRPTCTWPVPASLHAA